MFSKFKGTGKFFLKKKYIRYQNFYIFLKSHILKQKSVHLKLKVFIPSLTLKQNQIILFTKYSEGGTYIELRNTGSVPAIYKWKKMKEEWHYISEEDDIKQVASLILSDLMYMVELESPQLELDSATNMTLHYRKFKCLLKDLQDPINIKEILYDIIENLDLKAKRYKLHDQENFKDNTQSNLNEINHEILHKLNRISMQIIPQKIDDILNMEIEQSQEKFKENFNEIQDFFESQTLFVNRKFKAITSVTTFDMEKISDEECCVYHTLDYILGHLKLEDSYVISEPSSETCDLRNSVYFFEKCGLLAEEQKEMCALHIPAIRKGIFT